MSQQGVHLSKLRVLVAEATPNMRTTMRHVLGSIGIRNVRTVHNAVSAVDFLTLNRVDIAFIDMALEDWPGVHVLNAIRRGSDNPNRNLPAVLTAFEPKRGDLLEALQLGATTFLSKPLNTKTVHARIIASLDTQRPFVDTKAYVGPERRKKAQELPEGVEQDRRCIKVATDTGKSELSMSRVLIETPNTDAARKRAEEQKGRTAAVLRKEMELNKVVDVSGKQSYYERRVKVVDLVPGLQLSRSCEMKGGAILIGPGITLTRKAIRRMIDCVAAKKIEETVFIMIPDETGSD